MNRNFRIKVFLALLGGLFLVSTHSNVLAADEQQSEVGPPAKPDNEQATEAVPASAANDLPSRLASLAERLEFGADNVDVVWLGAKGDKRLALFQPPSQADVHGAVITILGSGKILERSEFARSIRQSLSASNWASLVVQSDTMVSGKASLLTPDEAQQLFADAIAYVQQQNYTRFVLVADSEIASLVWPVVQNQEEDLLGFVGLDEWVAKEFAPSIPVLNVANSMRPNAVTNARKRFNLVKHNPSASCEIYFYAGNLSTDRGFGQLVSRRIRGWLQRKFVETG